MTGATYDTTPLRALRQLARRGLRSAGEEADRRYAVIEQAMIDEGVPPKLRPIRAVGIDRLITDTAREEARAS